jgi:hypothetical protein
VVKMDHPRTLSSLMLAASAPSLVQLAVRALPAAEAAKVAVEEPVVALALLPAVVLHPPTCPNQRI